MTITGRSMHDQNRIRDLARIIFVDLPQGAVMDFQFRQRFPRAESEIADGVIALGGRGCWRGRAGKRNGCERDQREVTHLRSWRLTPVGARIRNPAFDVTPHRYIAGIVTEKGIFRDPYTESLRSAFEQLR